MMETLQTPDIEQRRVNHPDFLAVYSRGMYGFPVVVFERRMWRHPTRLQSRWYLFRKRIVQALGGRMCRLHYEVAGKNPPFSESDCAAMRWAVVRDLPDYEIRDHWNGAGCYSYSVSIQPRDQE